MYIRVTRGHFDPVVAEQVAALAGEVASAMESLPGMQEFFQGMNVAAGNIVGISFWDTEEHACFPSEALGEVFGKLSARGVRLDPPRICEID